MFTNSAYFCRALLSWAYWTGRQEMVDEVQCNSKAFWHRHEPDIAHLVAKLVSRLFFPLPADTKFSTDLAIRNWSDPLYIEISRRLNVEPKPFWPDNRSSAFILSHDVDRVKLTYQKAARNLARGDILGAFSSLWLQLFGKEKRRDSNSYYNFEQILSKQQEWGIPSTLFILREKRRIVELLKGRPQHVFGVYDPKEIVEDLLPFLEKENELGLHLSLDSYRSTDHLKQETNYLNGLIKTKVRGVRSHYLNFDEMTPDLLLNENFLYDSSYGINFTNGFRSGTMFPFLLRSTDQQMLWEIPFQLMDTALLWQYEQSKSWHEIEKNVKSLARNVHEGGGLLVLNWHQRHFNMGEEPKLFELFNGLITTLQQQNGWFTTPLRLHRWWSQERLTQNV